MTCHPEDLAATKESITLAPPAFLERCQQHAAWVADCMKPDTDDQWFPNLQIWTKSGFEAEEQIEMQSLYVPFNTDEEKHAVMAARGRALGEVPKVQCPTCIIFSSEAWQTSDDRFMGGRDAAEPKDDPRKREVVVVQGLAVATQQYLHAVAPLVRDGDRLCEALQFQPFSTPVRPLRLLDWFMGAYVEAVGRKIGARGN